MEWITSKINSQLNSIKLCLQAHPDNVANSEFADRISDLEDLPSQIQLALEKQRLEGILTGLKICKEMWARGEISHENIYENEVLYQEELKNLTA